MGSGGDICECLLLVCALFGLAYFAASIADENRCRKTNCTVKLIKPCIKKITRWAKQQ
jgi:hypothetical protein